MLKKYRKWGYVFMAPAVLTIFFVFVIPIFQNIRLSFFDSDGLTKNEFVMFGNYIKMFKDKNFTHSVIISILWVLFAIVFCCGIGLLVAVFLNRLKGASFFKTIFILPLTISFVSAGALWTNMFSKQYGVINEILRLLGSTEKINWLYSIPLNNLSIMFAYFWTQMGNSLIMFLMGLTSLPKDQVEAAYIDGCNGFQAFIHVIFPMLKPVTTVVVGMAIVNSFKVFDLIYVMTGGGPIRSSETLAVNMFIETFQRSNQGYGSAIGVFLTLLILPVTAIYMRATTSVDNAQEK